MYPELLEAQYKPCCPSHPLTSYQNSGTSASQALLCVKERQGSKRVLSGQAQCWAQTMKGTHVGLRYDHANKLGILTVRQHLVLCAKNGT